uniref:Uncharacterized protein n=1 Tax=uncultured marine virus TaxID=186617 RepID=A0A0F7LAL7_9VIRU|nr:hypothetical protein [uncultured marine virus]
MVASCAALKDGEHIVRRLERIATDTEFDDVAAHLSRHVQGSVSASDEVVGSRDVVDGDHRLKWSQSG